MKTSLIVTLAALALLWTAVASAQDRDPASCRCASPDSALYKLHQLHRSSEGALVLDAQVTLKLCCQEDKTWRRLYLLSPTGTLSALDALPAGAAPVSWKPDAKLITTAVGYMTVELRREHTVPLTVGALPFAKLNELAQSVWMPIQEDACLPDAQGWTSCDEKPVALVGQPARQVHQHPSAPMMLDPTAAPPKTSYLDVAGLGQVVVVHKDAAPQCKGQLLAHGTLHRVSLGGPEGTKRSYKGWRLSGATLSCLP